VGYISIVELRDRFELRDRLLIVKMIVVSWVLFLSFGFLGFKHWVLV
jgi:hypothetical protein